MKPRVAIVVQRCGREVNGGAEVHALEIAREMAEVWDVTILTTTARDYMTWEPFYETGPGEIDGIPVIRFDVDEERNVRAFDGLSARVLARGKALTLVEGERWMRSQGPYSTALLDHLRENREAYETFFFFTYLYATTYFGLPLVADRAILAPLAHDEWPIHLPMWDEFFRLPQRFVFNTVEERDFLRRRFPNAALEGPVVGVGIRIPDDVRADRFRRRYGVENPLAVYVGRIDPSKGCERLLTDFARYKDVVDDDLLLVLVGREAMPIPKRPYLRALGFVDEETKYDAIAAAEFLIMPSALESLSLVLLESWSQSRPVLVNAESDVLVGQTRRANGGLWYADSSEFSAAIPFLRDRSIADELGRCGRAFVQQNYTWPAVRASYVEVFESVAASAPREPAR